ncbi:MAG: hypothetical protein QHH14_11290 [Clostridiales bacterium]|jgi:hypothetical protein|nr:hypothetical protein [Clostridiales bacterium]
MENIQITEKAIVLAQEAQSLVVRDQQSANRATELILAGKEMVKRIKDYFSPLKKAADEAKKKLLEAEKAELQKVEPYVEKLQSSLTAWRLEEERKRREAEEAARRAELERKRLEEELLRKAEEARRLEEEKKRVEGEEAARKAREELERRALEEAAAREAQLIPPPPIPEKPKTDGLTLRENWSFEIVDESQIPREYLIPDPVKIRRVVQVMKDKTNIPGIRVFNQPVVVKTR